MDVEKAKNFVNRGIHNWGIKQAYSLISANIAVLLMTTVSIIATERFLCLIPYGTIFLCYIPTVIILNSKARNCKNHILFLSLCISFLMVIMSVNFLSQCMLIWFDAYSLGKIVLVVAAQIIVFFISIWTNIIIAKKQSKKQTTRILILLPIIWAIIVMGVAIYVEINGTSQTIIIFLVGVFYSMVMGFVFFFAQLSLKWYYCKKFNISCTEKDSNPR